MSHRTLQVELPGEDAVGVGLVQAREAIEREQRVFCEEGDDSIQ